MKKARIIGTGSYLPERVLTNAELEKLVETTDEWIVSRTGMKERRIAAEGEFPSDMGVLAAKKAIETAGIDPKTIDLILVATLTPDYSFPSTACLIQAKLGLSAGAMDLQAACSGFIYALAVARAFIESGLHETILVVATEKLSSITDYQDRATCILFGDGAGACIVSGEGKGLLIQETVMGSDGEQAELLLRPAGGSRHPTTKETVEQKMHYIKMEGREIFKHAVRRMESSSKECIEKAGLTEGDISWLVPHQANIRIIEAIGKRFEVPKERVFVTVDKYGNTSASSIIIALDELLRTQTLSSGEVILLTAFGAGLTWGSSLLKYE